MELPTKVDIEGLSVELVNFLGNEIPEKFSVLFWISPEDFEDPWTVKFFYEIGAEGTPTVMETRLSGFGGLGHFPYYQRGRVFRHHFGWIEKNYTELFITGLQIVSQIKYTPEKLGSGHIYRKSLKKVEPMTNKKFEVQVRGILKKSRTRTPEFYAEVARKRALYMEEHGSHYGFNKKLAEAEGVSTKMVEKWVETIDSFPVKKTGSKSHKSKG